MKIMIIFQQGIPQMRPMGVRPPMGGIMPMGMPQNIPQQPQMMIPQQTQHPATNSNVQLDPFGAL